MDGWPLISCIEIRVKFPYSCKQVPVQIDGIYPSMPPALAQGVEVHSHAPDKIDRYIDRLLVVFHKQLKNCHFNSKNILSVKKRLGFIIDI